MNREYLATHGQSNHLGRFVSSEALDLQRGDRIVIETARGLEIGNVLCPATEQHVRLLRVPPGRLLHQITAEDEQALTHRRRVAEQLFQSGRDLILELELDLEILDVEVLLDGRRAVLQFLGDESEAESLAEALTARCRLAVLMENLAAAPEAPAESGCGKPDCGHGKEGGCTSCSSGGCSTGGCATGCGTGGTKVDMREYFAHLRGKMEAQRVPLV